MDEERRAIRTCSMLFPLEGPKQKSLHKRADGTGNEEERSQHGVGDAGPFNARCL